MLMTERGFQYVALVAYHGRQPVSRRRLIHSSLQATI